MSNPTLNSLADTIAQAASTITSYLESNKLPAPSFSENGPASYPMAPEVQGARLQLLGALSDMTHLTMGPESFSILQPIYSNHDMMVLDILNQFDFFSAVPLGRSVTYRYIARVTTIPELFVRRILRYAFTLRLFAETRPGSGYIVHTATTAFLARNPVMRSMVSHNLKEVRLADHYVPESLRKYSVGKATISQEIHESRFAIDNIYRTGRPTTYWEHIKRTPHGNTDGCRDKCFSEAMQVATAASPINSSQSLSEVYDWAGLGDAFIVDVGGSSGHDAILLAKAYPNLSIIVQDLPEVEQAFRSYVPQELLGQIAFQPHDFFTPQTVLADVYILKTILHDWPDKYVAKILQNIVPCLTPKSRILLFEPVFPSPDADGKLEISPTRMHMMGAADLHMTSLLNSSDRTLEEWQAVVKHADERLEAQVVVTSTGPSRSIIELTFHP